MKNKNVRGEWQVVRLAKRQYRPFAKQTVNPRINVGAVLLDPHKRQVRRQSWVNVACEIGKIASSPKFVYFSAGVPALMNTCYHIPDNCDGASPG